LPYAHILPIHPSSLSAEKIMLPPISGMNYFVSSAILHVITYDIIKMVTTGQMIKPRSF
jgi:hypothetical protein